MNDAIAFSYSVNSPVDYIENQALEVIRRVCGQFPFYHKSEPCLIRDTAIIGSCMKGLLEDKVEICGCEIVRMELMEIAY